ncbi:hypothetical protein LNP17_09160 [Klebsiella variicola subsp. variicola]|nr:hypothetical protein [Klebsiella variicola subsp. variicola]
MERYLQLCAEAEHAGLRTVHPGTGLPYAASSGAARYAPSAGGDVAGSLCCATRWRSPAWTNWRTAPLCRPSAKSTNSIRKP